MTSVLAKTRATWFMSPNHEWIPVMLVCVEKLEMASVMLDVGFIPSMAILKPPKSTSSLPNLNFLGLNVPFLAKWVPYCNVCQKEPSRFESHRMVSLTLEIFLYRSTVMSSNHSVYASPQA